MKRTSILLLCLCLAAIAAFAQPITITDSGRNLIVTRNGVSRTLPKTHISTKYRDPYLEMTYKYESVFRISSNTEVTSPASTSMADLMSKIYAMFPAASSGGITTELDPTVPSNVKSISAGDITNWNSKVSPSGTSSQYIAGDGSKITFPSIVSLSGTNTWTGSNVFSTSTSFSSGILPTSNGTGSIGSSSQRFNGAFFTTINVGSTSTFSSVVTMPGLSVYADNAAAITAGLSVGALYRTSTGVLMIRY